MFAGDCCPVCQSILCTKQYFVPTYQLKSEQMKTTRISGYIRRSFICRPIMPNYMKKEIVVKANELLSKSLFNKCCEKRTFKCKCYDFYDNLECDRQYFANTWQLKTELVSIKLPNIFLILCHPIMPADLQKEIQSNAVGKKQKRLENMVSDLHLPGFIGKKRKRAEIEKVANDRIKDIAAELHSIKNGPAVIGCHASTKPSTKDIVGPPCKSSDFQADLFKTREELEKVKSRAQELAAENSKLKTKISHMGEIVSIYKEKKSSVEDIIAKLETYTNMFINGYPTMIKIDDTINIRSNRDTINYIVSIFDTFLFSAKGIKYRAVKPYLIFCHYISKVKNPAATDINGLTYKDKWAEIAEDVVHNIDDPIASLIRMINDVYNIWRQIYFNKY